MGWRLAGTDERPSSAFIKRFDPRFWTVNFPRPMMAAVTNPAPDALAVTATFYRANDLAGLIWESADTRDHPLLRYETDRDLRGCVLSFRWQATGSKPLDAVHGPTLTIEGRDAAGQPRAWYVRLWSYAAGAPDDAVVTLDFDALDGGFLLPGEADPVWAGDVDRLFVSLVAPGYDDSDAPLPAIAEAEVSLTELRCDGARAVLAIGDPLVPAHGLRIATGYDDAYNLTPARVLRNILQLGYRGPINHYVGMSHHFRLASDTLLATTDGGVLNAPCLAWHRAFAAEAALLGYELILSLSYELLDQHCPAAWKQRAADGTPALTGWVPPSTLLSPASAEQWPICRRWRGRSWRWWPTPGCRCASSSASRGGGRRPAARSASMMRRRRRRWAPPPWRRSMTCAATSTPGSERCWIAPASCWQARPRRSPPPCGRWRLRPSCCCWPTCRPCSIPARPSLRARTCRSAGRVPPSTSSSWRIMTGRPPAT